MNTSSLPRPSKIVGEVHGFQERREEGEILPIVWSFRIHQNDAVTGATTAIPVEMRGRSFSGAIKDGDEVSAIGHWQPGETLILTEVTNKITGAVVRVKKSKVTGAFVVLLGIVAVFFWAAPLSFFRFAPEFPFLVRVPVRA